MKKVILLAIIACAIDVSAQIGAKVQQQSKLTGLWQNSQFGYQMTLMLNDNGTGEFDGDEIKYTAKDGKLSLRVVSQNETTAYSYSLAGDELTVSGGDLEQPVKFTRAGTSGTTTGTAAATAPAADNNTSSTIDKNLIGAWSGSNESMEFRADGTCMYNGAPIPYTTSQGHIIITNAQGQVMMAYIIDGDQLRLTVNGAQYTYSRGGTAAQGTAAVTPAGRNVPQELAGKWCWINVGSNNASMSSECWVLRADGTYLYSSESSRSVNSTTVTGGTSSQSGDAGMWWVEGNRLHYQSQTQGQGSYVLEKRNHPKNVGDPMIVLNGQPYVTATYRQPWR